MSSSFPFASDYRVGRFKFKFRHDSKAHETQEFSAAATAAAVVFPSQSGEFGSFFEDNRS
jgi:hypothetical protein